MSKAQKPPPEISPPDLRILQAERLQDDLALKEAIEELEVAIKVCGSEAVLAAVLSRPNALPFSISVIGKSALEDLVMEMLVSGDKTSWSQDGLAWQVLASLAGSAFFLQVQRSAEEEQQLRDHHQLVSAAQPLLKLIPTLVFAPAPLEDENPPADEPDFGFAVTVKQSQRDRKNAKKRSQKSKVGPSTRVHEAAFSALGFDVPTTQDAADEIYKKTIGRCKKAFEDLVNYFCTSAPKDVLKDAYIPPVHDPSAMIETAQDASLIASAEALAEGEFSSAYPAVQPMRAALYFDSAEGFGAWSIFVGQRATADLREAKRKSPDFYDIFVKKIKELSNGHFSGDNQKRLTGPNTPVPVYEAKMSRDTRLIYQVDVVPEVEAKVERQVIRIFGIKTHAQMDKRLWDSVGYQLSRRGKEYQKRCVHRKPYSSTKGETSYLPQEWPFEGERAGNTHEEVVQSKAADEPEMSKDHLEEMHSLLVLDKYVSLSQAYLNSILADQDFTHVFHVSPHEQEIIEHDHSCYVMGRSGTGKTTTMLFKMLGIENSWQQLQQTEASENLSRPRQLFVTQSRVLADKVEEYFVKLLEFLHFASQNESNDSLRELLGRRQAREEAGLVDRDEAIDWREDLPTHFSKLQDTHFPMFITFDKLSTLLEADMQKSLVSKDETGQGSSAVAMPNPLNNEGGTSEYMLQRRSNFVSFNVFRDEYWPHFPQSLTKGVDPALVFSEFMGVIKGSEQAVNSDKETFWLSMSEYIKLSTRSQAMFSGRRKEVYRLFEAYVRMRRDRGDYDAADRTHAILREVKARGVAGKKLDFLYVDEVQDNLLIDAMLLRLICVNPEGLFWAGDTAQTISVGSSFRFNDLKAFLYRVEESAAASLKSSNVHQKTAREPKSFQLTTNFRSHGGIVRAAHAVVTLISKFWPYALDTLAPEFGVVDGIKPVFFSGWNTDNVRYESFLFGEAGAQIEFGAQQCILVRNDASRERLREQVGDIGLILTLYESKGLEFNDVMLFNFFEDSTVDASSWRVVLNALEVEQRGGESAPDFNESKHAGVCSELKFLYVAVTRARKNLWIVDTSERGTAMRRYWIAQNLVQHHTPESEIELPQLAAASTPEEWSKTALTLFQNKRYLQAMHAFDRAELPREKAASYAYFLREQAYATSARKAGDAEDARRLAYVSAAEAFVSSAKAATRERREYFRIAATLYVAVDEHEAAGDAYLEGTFFTEAAQSYRKAGTFDKTVDVLLKHREEVDPVVGERLLSVSRLYYFKQHDLQRASQLFDTVEEKLDYCEQYDLDDIRAQLLEDAGRFSEAAELLLNEGRTMEAIDLYLRDDTSPDSRSKAKTCILEALWERLSFGIMPDPVNATAYASIQALFTLLRRLDLSDLDTRSRVEVEVFRAIERRDPAVLRTLGMLLAQRGAGYIDLTLLCLDHGFANTKNLLPNDGEQIIKILDDYNAYLRFLSSAAFHKEPWASPLLRRLFAFRATDDGLVQLGEGSFLHASYLRFNPAGLAGEAPALPEFKLRSLFHKALSERMQISVDSVNQQCLSARVFEPCKRHATGHCDSGNSCEYEHKLDQAWFTRRFRFYLLQGFMLNTCQNLTVEMSGGKRILSQAQRNVRIWLERVEEVFFPIHYSFGSTTALSKKHISEVDYRRGLVLIGECVRGCLYSLSAQEAQSPAIFVKTVLVAFNLGFAFDRAAVSQYLPGTTLTAAKVAVAPYLVHQSRGGSNNVLYFLMEFYRGKESWSLYAGLEFLRHVIGKQLAVDVGRLSSFLDRLCSSVIFARRLKFREPTLHDLTLPRSWILDRLADDSLLSGKDIPPGDHIVGLVSGLLKELHSPPDNRTDHILYNGKPMKLISPTTKNMLIARICRCLVLFGYNMGSPGLQGHVFRAVTGLKSLSKLPVPRHYAQFVDATDSMRLGIAATSSITNSTLDEMILLYRIGSRNSPVNNPKVRRVDYKTVNEIYELLGSSETPPSRLRAEAAPFIPAAASSVSPNPSESQLATAEGARTEETDAMQEDAEAVTASMQAVTSPAVDPEEVLRRERAALFFVKAYRRMLRRRTNHVLPGVPKARLEQITAFFLEDNRIEWTATSLYRLLFRGPLPHALTCLDRLLDQAQGDKNKVKIRIRIAQHEVLETLMAEQTRISANVKELLALRKSLEPSSSLHREKDIAKLRPLVARVCELVDTLEKPGNVRLHFDRDVAFRGIVKEPPPPKTKSSKKPKLNTGDLHGLVDDDDDDASVSDVELEEAEG